MASEFVVGKVVFKKINSTKNRIDATKVAYDLFQVFITQPTKYTKIDARNSFKFYADKLIERQRRDLRFSEPKSDFAFKFNIGDPMGAFPNLCCYPLLII